MNRFFFLLFVILISCKTQYKTIVSTIGKLPPQKLLHSNKSSSGTTSNVDSISKLSNYVSSKERFELILDLDKDLKGKFYAYKDNKNDENYNDVVKRLNELSIEDDITFNVEVRTKEPGATVLYRIESEKEEKTAHNPTNNCFINLNIGNYYIWTVRSDRKTSQPKKYFLGAKDSLTISEKRKR